MGKHKKHKSEKQREEEQAIGAIYKQYIDTFQENSELKMKTFVKSATLYAESKDENSDKGQLYTPKPLVNYRKPVTSSNTTSINRSVSPVNPFARKRSKSKSNLKALGDELKMLQHERQTKEHVAKLPTDPQILVPPTTISSNTTPEGDYTISTNLFVSNLQPHVTENTLIDLFGAYGPLASVKIMWPRGGDASKAANCGFVAYMSRADAERALEGLKNRTDMRISWGKAVKIPQHPIHVPPELAKLYSPPPLSGLPFNAQVVSYKTIEDLKNGDLSTTVVKVTIPFNRNQLMLIHRMIEFVIREGPEFEAVIMTKEQNNPEFDFLFDFQSPAHTYYRWKLYSMLNSDQKGSWSTKPFRMYQGGSIWLPPVAPNYAEGMPPELIAGVNGDDERKLTEAQTTRLVFLIRNLTCHRLSIAKATVFCMNHSMSIDQIMDILTESLLNAKTNPQKKLARLYLVSDLVHNCRMKNVALAKFEDNCLYIFQGLHASCAGFKHANDRDIFQVKVLRVLRSWLFQKILDSNCVTKFENCFLTGNETGDDDNSSLNDEPLDGANLLKRSVLTTTTDCLIVKKNEIEDMFNSSP